MFCNLWLDFLFSVFSNKTSCVAICNCFKVLVSKLQTEGKISLICNYYLFGELRSGKCC